MHCDVIYACMHVCMYACMHACMYVCMHVCMYVCTYVWIHVYYAIICVCYIYIYTRSYVYIYIYIYVHLCTHNWRCVCIISYFYIRSILYIYECKACYHLCIQILYPIIYCWVSRQPVHITSSESSCLDSGWEMCGWVFGLLVYGANKYWYISCINVTWITFKIWHLINNENIEYTFYNAWKYDIQIHIPK